MLKLTPILLLLLFILQNASLVSSVSFSLDLEPNPSGLWKLSNDDYRNLEEGNPGATLKSGTDFPSDPVNRNMRIYLSMKLVITKPLSSNVTCDQDFIRSFESMNLSHLRNIQCVGATASVVGILGWWSIPEISSTSGITKPNPINLKYLVGGNATIRMSNSKENVLRQGSCLVTTAYIFEPLSWTDLKVDSSLGKVSVEATVKNDAIMLLLDIIRFDPLAPGLFEFNESRVNYQFDWKPDGLLIRETRDIFGGHKSRKSLSVLKQVYPESWEEVLHPHVKHVRRHKTNFGKSGQTGPAKPAEVLILSAAIISVAYAHATF